MVRVGVSCLLALLALLPSLAAPLSAVDVRGKRVAVSAPPQRIVSLVPGGTEILFALGLQGRIVADTIWCDYPPAARRLPHVGDLTTSIERVIAQRPDLVVASVSANRAAIERLERLSGKRIPVFAIDPQNLAELYGAIRGVGAITGQVRPAQDLVRALQGRVTAVQQAVARDRARPRVLFVVQQEPLWVIGSRNFMDEMIAIAGGVNMTRDVGAGFHTYSLERVIIGKPEVILATQQGLQGFRGRVGWSGLDAVKRGAVYVLGYEAVRPAPRIIDAIERIARILHPGIAIGAGPARR